MLQLTDEIYAISPYHLSLLKLYEVLDFVDFPFLQSEISPDGKIYLDYFVKNEEYLEHRILVESTYGQIVLVKLGLISVNTVFEDSIGDHVFSILISKQGSIEKAFDIPKAIFLANNPIPKDYFIELAGEYIDDPALTDYHAKYYAYELTKTASSDDTNRLASAMFDAQVELNPHQVDAALFAFQSPLSKGVILADEVGLGKTIEAGLVIAQKWAERKRKILIVVPANLRKQWSQEMIDKFFIPSLILETKSFNQSIKNGNLNPFEQKDLLVITSYNFIKSKDAYVKLIDWDIVIIDEAHRLRNVYKPQNKTANAIKNALLHVDKKILLTATPLQNSLLELYGLVSIIDDYAFGDFKSFRSQYTRTDEDHVNYQELKDRLAPICKRTLRKQVLAYIPYTNRISITEDFTPSADEQRLYELISDYLQAESLYALPSSQRQLMTLILRRLLASSTYAISGTLQVLTDKLNAILAGQPELVPVEAQIGEDFEALNDLKEEWEEDGDEEEDEDSKKKAAIFSEDERKGIASELNSLGEFLQLAKSITRNSKGEKLLTALKRGFQELEKMGALKKAIIFTESTRTQLYIKTILDESEFAGKIVLFNGSNTDAESKAVYQQWLEKHAGTDKVSGSKTADMRAALVEYFRNTANIMIATEAAAEGINLQFCSLVVNYDLPWNPQRIEQRIGRCHRYGQKHDVVVVNFLNRKNEADQRVFELLKNKFKLFDGVFGASDEVLGVLGSGVDFEKRIIDIYQTCRTQDAIQLAFDFLQKELEIEITEAVSTARKSLLENFDDEVNEKLKIRQEQSGMILNKYENWLWNLTTYFLHGKASFDNERYFFNLTQNPFPELPIHNGPYIINSKTAQRKIEDDISNIYRINHPLAQAIIGAVKNEALPVTELIFDYTATPKKVSVVEELKYKSGWLIAVNAIFSGFETENRLVFTAVTEDGTLLDSNQAARLFSINARKGLRSIAIPDKLATDLSSLQEDQLSDLQFGIECKNNEFFQLEVDKLHNWADDRVKAAEKELKDTKEKIKVLNRDAKKTKDLKEQLRIQNDIKMLSALQNKLRQNIFSLEDEIQNHRDRMIGEIEKRMNLQVSTEPLFTIRWIVI